MANAPESVSPRQRGSPRSKGGQSFTRFTPVRPVRPRSPISDRRLRKQLAKSSERRAQAQKVRVLAKASDANYGQWWPASSSRGGVVGMMGTGGDSSSNHDDDHAGRFY